MPSGVSPAIMISSSCLNHVGIDVSEVVTPHHASRRWREESGERLNYLLARFGLEHLDLRLSEVDVCTSRRWRRRLGRAARFKVLAVETRAMVRFARGFASVSSGSGRFACSWLLLARSEYANAPDTCSKDAGSLRPVSASSRADGLILSEHARDVRG